MSSRVFDPSVIGASAANIRKVYRRASAEDRELGANWYSVAHQLAEPIGHGDHNIGAGILAALSPQIGWPTNVALAQRLSRTRRFSGGHYRACLDKAKRIHRGESAASVLHGPKESAFYCNIANPSACPHPLYCVTIDRHILHAVIGRVLTDRERNNTLRRAGAYAAIAGLFRTVAAELRLTPDTLQAIVWVVWRREHGI